MFFYILDEASCEPFNLNEDGTEVVGSLIHNYFKKMKCTYVVGGLNKVKQLQISRSSNILLFLFTVLKFEKHT